MARFYERLRRDTGYLMEADGTPRGGKFSFDTDNRQKLPQSLTLPPDIQWLAAPEITDAIAWLDTFESERYGEAHVWVPYTRAGAEQFLAEFLRTRFHAFGPYEDALTTRHVRLFHSTLSPLINIGLLSPRQIIDEAIAYATAHQVPLNSLEGFVRQILGWREFIRASYEVDGRAMRTSNFFTHTRRLPASTWTGTTGLLPVDHVTQTALTYGYTHHIERLMVMGNFFLLTGTHPDDVYRWFMGMFVDAYDWVMVPNVYGMSQFADGGSFATKPYISGASYLKKMSDYPKGDWEAIWTALYWQFITNHETVFARNHRLRMMLTLHARMSPAVRAQHTATASAFLARLSSCTP
jgi:deoxyribodipyrimidine photolyase-related protein